MQYATGGTIMIFILFNHCEDLIMPTAVKISDELAAKAKITSKVFKRSLAGQIEYWAKIGQIVEENPELPLPLIQDILMGKEQINAGQGTPYIFGE